MRKYELVIILDGRTSQDERAKAVSEIETALGQDSIITKDEIGAMDAAYDLSGKKGNNKMYLISYYCELSPERLKEIKAAIAYIKGLQRHFFYAMTPTQKFFTFKELSDVFAAMEKEQEKKSEAKK